MTETAYNKKPFTRVFLHDLFVNIEAVSAAEYKQFLNINYSFSNTPFGDILIASTAKGICYLAFADNKTLALETLKRHFPHAQFKQNLDDFQQNALTLFTHDCATGQRIQLHITGTDFQIKVWQALLQIPFGELTSYGAIANTIGTPKASRAVGTAIKNNPVAFIIPCHRIIQSTGAYGGYMWGTERKVAIITWEKTNTEVDF